MDPTGFFVAANSHQIIDMLDVASVKLGQFSIIPDERCHGFTVSLARRIVLASLGRAFKKLI